MKKITCNTTAALMMLALAACGGSGSGTDSGISGNPASLPPGYSAVILTGGANGSLALHTPSGTVTKSLVKDASSESTASGAGSGVVSLGDSAATSCAFSFDSSSNSTGISVVASGQEGTCANSNKCIVCTTATSGSNCSISCAGIVPSNAATAADTFDIFVTYTSELETNMQDAGGMVRLDAKASSWNEFVMGDGNGSSENVVLDSSGCMGGSGKVELANDGNGNDEPAYSNIDVYELNAGWEIIDLTPDGNGFSGCTLEARFQASMPLTGADTPGATINLTRGTVKFRAQICNVAGASASDPNCPGPTGW